LMRLTRWAAALVSTAVVGLVLAACGGSSSGSGASSSTSSASSSSATGQAFQSAHKGGTLRLLAKTAGGTLDPKINYTLQYWQLYQGVYDGLTAFQQVGGQSSFTIVPDLAEAIPTPTNGGKTYVFQLRKGIKFSDGTPLTVDDVVASFQRIFKVSGPTAGSFYNGIVGATACLKTPASCTLAGGVVGDATNNTVTINLTTPDTEFLYKLSVPHASVEPKGSPAKDSGSTPLAGTGAYTIKSYDPNKSLILVRNPYFKEWDRAAQPEGYPDTIEEDFGGTVESEVTAVENGQADWVFDDLPADRLSEIGTKYEAQAHVNPLTAFWYLPMNTNLAPFNNLKARQAVNWAVDRNAIVKLFGGSNLAQPVCTFLPPGFPGHVDNCQYSNPAGTTWKGPDLAKAKQLVQESGTAGQTVQVITTDDEVNKAIGENVASTLTQIGYKATAKPISANIQFTYIQNTKNKVQISLSQWYQDYPAASDFLNVLEGCASFTPGSDSSINIAGFCNKGIQAQMDAALVTAQTNPTAANAQWAKVDQAVMTNAPVAPLITPKKIDFLAKRVGNYQFSKEFYMILSQVWVQ
jgi:peptide/nickel transport system substrate-binding protein